MPGPVYFYYTLRNFYQNHRRYVVSRDDMQLRGDFSAPSAACAFADSYKVGDDTVGFYPCGLGARALFNDSFALSDPDGTAIAWTSEGVAWASAEHKFKSKDEAWLRENCYALGRDVGGRRTLEGTGFPAALAGFNGTWDAARSKFDCWTAVDTEEFAVWMRHAGRSEFQKLHRIIPDGLRQGVHRLEVGLHFPVAPFAGAKGFVLSTASPLGGRVAGLAALALATGCISLLFAVVLLAGAALRKEPAPMPVVQYPEVTIAEGKASMIIKPTVWTRVRHASRSMLFSFAPGRSGGNSIASGATMSMAIEKRYVKCPPDVERHDSFASNFVSTTKFTMLNFVPKDLFIQFQRFANWSPPPARAPARNPPRPRRAEAWAGGRGSYFLVIAILASIAEISPVSGSTFWLPLGVVLTFTMLKDGYEDYQRYKSDVEENSRVTEVWIAAERDFRAVPWKDVQVGSVVCVRANDPQSSPMIPADLSLLATAAEDGTCFLETANLDGETNLKLREAPEATHRRLARGEEVDLAALAALAVEVTCTVPDAYLYDFNARMELDGQDVSLSGGAGGGQFLQRSSKLRNTKWVLGVAVYTGRETKIQMNMSDPPNKVSGIERSLNNFILALFALLCAICTTGGVAAGVWIGQPEAKASWYLAPEQATAAFDVSAPAYSGFISFFSFLILNSLLIPISLYVSIEFVKIFIAVIISGDREMYAADDDIPSLARSAGLCEELGQVTYIFSDKTGTLTQNVMEFKKCSVGGVEYGRGFCEVERAIARKDGRALPPDPLPPPGLDMSFKFVDERLLFGRWREQPTSREAESFFLNLALNHNVQVEFGKETPDTPLFQAESPDEGAFVEAARNFGYYFLRRNMKQVTLRIAAEGGAVGSGAEAEFTVLAFNGFDNNRKRTSAVVRRPDGRVLLLVKGADACVMPFVDRAASPNAGQTQQHIDRFSEQGLRTLLFAGREMEEAEYAAWAEKHHAASLLSEGREQALRQVAAALEEGHTADGQESALFDSSCQFEPRLAVHGVSALEDKLQENVGECISQLSRAMIKIWVLTGDKLETAINIGYATALLGSEMEPLLRISQEELMEPPTDAWRAGAAHLELSLAAALEAKSDREALREALRAAAALPGAPEFLGQARELLASGEERIVEARVREALLAERVRRRVAALHDEMAEGRSGGYALVIDGPCLRAAMEPALRLDFLRVGIRCRSVVCCRVTPSQKAQVTLLVKDNVRGQITLAIGDGANDVSMIQAAHVGVGIRGKEGQQAVLASDYALPRFAFLERLLLVHGRWSYNRIGTMVCYFFYKTISFALTAFWFATSNAWSATQIYNDGTQSMYNLIWTSVPVMLFAVLDRDIEAAVVRAHPELYSTGQFGVRFTPLRFGTFILGAPPRPPPHTCTRPLTRRGVPCRQGRSCTRCSSTSGSPPPSYCCPYPCPYCTLTPSLPRWWRRWTWTPWKQAGARRGCARWA